MAFAVQSTAAVGATRLHSETARNLYILSDAGQRLARQLFTLRLGGIYIAVDQVQLTADAPWQDALLRGVKRALQDALARAFEMVEIAWCAMMLPPKVDRA